MWECWSENRLSVECTQSLGRKSNIVLRVTGEVRGRSVPVYWANRKICEASDWNALLRAAVVDA